MTLGKLTSFSVWHHPERGNNNRQCKIIVRPDELIMNMMHTVPCLAHDKPSQGYSCYFCGRPKNEELRSQDGSQHV